MNFLSSKISSKQARSSVIVGCIVTTALVLWIGRDSSSTDRRPVANLNGDTTNAIALNRESAVTRQSESSGEAQAFKNSYEEWMRLHVAYGKRSKELAAQYPLRVQAIYLLNQMGAERYKIGRPDRFSRNWKDESIEIEEFQKNNPAKANEFDTLRTLSSLLALGERFPSSEANDSIEALREISSESFKNPAYAVKVAKMLATVESAYFGNSPQLIEIQRSTPDRVQELLERNLSRYQAAFAPAYAVSGLPDDRVETWKMESSNLASDFLLNQYLNETEGDLRSIAEDRNRVGREIRSSLQNIKMPEMERQQIRAYILELRKSFGGGLSGFDEWLAMLANSRQ